MEPEVIKTLFIVALLAIIGLGNYLFFRMGVKLADNRLREVYDRGYENGMADAVSAVGGFIKDSQMNPQGFTKDKSQEPAKEDK